MRVVKDIRELKIGDKLDRVDRPSIYDEYGIVYLIVTDLMILQKRVRVNIIDYKGKIVTWTTFDIVEYDIPLKFYEDVPRET